jgi:hypothetical protein
MNTITEHSEISGKGFQVRQQQINDALPTETLGGHDQLKRGKTEIY